MNIEAHEQEKLCKYLDYQYPHVLYCPDLSGVRLPIGLAKKMKRIRKGRAWPDIFFPEPRDGFHGLYVELKAPGVKITTKTGEIVANEHLREQNDMFVELSNKGYRAVFAIGFEGAKKVVDEYFK